MPRRKNPNALKLLAKQKVLENLEKVNTEWLPVIVKSQNLGHLNPELVDKMAYMWYFQRCHYLNVVPMPLINELVPDLMEVFGKLFQFYTTDYYEKLETGEVDVVFKMSLYQTLEKLNVSNLSNKSLQFLAVRNLRYLPYLTTLVLPSYLEHSRLVAHCIKPLSRLQEFEYGKHCCDDVIISLSFHCKGLVSLKVPGSTSVTDASFACLTKLRNLKYLDVFETGMGSQCYAAVFRHLPKLQNVRWHLQVDEILDSIDGKLPEVEVVECEAISCFKLTSCLLNIKTINLKYGCTSHDLTPLENLQHLRGLTLRRFDYPQTRLTTVLACIGDKLKEFSLVFVYRVDVSDIIGMCPNLNKLNFEFCSFEELVVEPPTSMKHYQHLREVSVIFNENELNYNSLLRNYSNLRRFKAYGYHLNDEFARKSINGFRRIETFIACSCQFTIDTAKLLITECPNLRELGKLKKWVGIDENSFRTLCYEMNRQNFDITLCAE